MLLGTRPVAAQMLMNDLTSGSYAVSIRSGDVGAIRSGTMLGGNRHTHLIVGDELANPLQQPGGLEILSSGYLVVNGGLQVYPRVEVTYGVDEIGQNAPLNENLAMAGDRFRLHFDAADRGLNVNVVVFTGTSYALLGYNLPPSNQAFTTDFPFEDFEEGGAVSWNSIDYIVLVVQSTLVKPMIGGSRR